MIATSTPAPKIHKQKCKARPDRAYIVWHDQRIWLGRWGSSESHAKYDRIIAEGNFSNGASPFTGTDITVAELAVQYLCHCDSYYRDSNEGDNIKLALRPVVALYGDVPASQFGPVERLTEAIRTIELQLQRLIDQHPHAEIFQSLPVKGLVSISGLLGGFAAQDAPRHTELAARWGVAPVIVASGRSRFVKYRRACDGYMREVLMFFAFNTAFRSDCWAHDYYRRKRAAGATHYGALRCLAQRWLKIICRMWTDKTTYDEQLHRRRLSLAP